MPHPCGTPRLPRLAAAAAALTLSASLVAGCSSPARKPAPGGGGAAATGTRSQDPARIAADISSLVAARAKGKTPVNTIVLGNIAVVGLGSPARADTGAVPDRTPAPAPAPEVTTPPGVAPRPGAQGGVAPPSTRPAGPTQGSTYTPKAGTTGVLSGSVTAEVRRRYPFLKRVYSTNDTVLVTRIASLARDLRNGVPLDRRIDEAAWVVRSVAAPAANAPAAPGPRS